MNVADAQRIGRSAKADKRRKKAQKAAKQLRSHDVECRAGRHAFSIRTGACKHCGISHIQATLGL